MTARDPAPVLCVHPDNVWGFRQNRPTLIAQDLEAWGVPRSATYAILLARGVFKWLAVRRDLIRLKNLWAHEAASVRRQIAKAEAEGRAHDSARLRERVATLADCRDDIRALCHSERWRAPAFDGAACAWLHSKAPILDVPDTLRRRLRRGREAA